MSRTAPDLTPSVTSSRESLPIDAESEWIRRSKRLLPQMIENTSPLEAMDGSVDHVRGREGAPLVVEYGDYECPYSRQAFREIERAERRLESGLRFVFRHFPLTDVHPHALAAAAAAEAAAQQDRFWEMHETLFHRQDALEDEDLRGYAWDLGLDLDRFDQDRVGDQVLARIRRDVESGLETGEVTGTPTLFVNGSVYQGPYDAATLAEVLSR
jgi:protein-disulfide isomerase